MKQGCIILIIYFVLLALLLSSCSAAYHLQRAITKGGKVQSDTTWKDLTFITPELRFGTTIRPNWQVHNIQKPFVAEDEDTGARTEVTIDLQDHCPPDCIDTVHILTVVPERIQKKSVPVGVDTEIKAGYTKWDLIILAIACLAVGAVGSRIFWRG